MIQAKSKKTVKKQKQKQKKPLAFKQDKSLGQVFLQSAWPAAMTIEALKERGVSDVLEIGPGAGALTRPLLKNGFRVTAIEKDQRFAEQLRPACGVYGEDELTIINEDILTFRLDLWLKEREHIKAKAIVGNIPYFISSQIAELTLRNMTELSCAILLTQLEFSERICSPKGLKSYGSLSVYAQLRARPQILAKVGRDLFYPIPKVDSALLLLDPPATEFPKELLRKSEQVSGMAFAQRRKVLRNGLKGLLASDLDLEEFPVDLTLRAEQLRPEDFIKIAEFLLGASV